MRGDFFIKINMFFNYNYEKVIFYIYEIIKYFYYIINKR